MPAKTLPRRHKTKTNVTLTFLSNIQKSHLCFPASLSREELTGHENATQGRVPSNKPSCSIIVLSDNVHEYQILFHRNIDLMYNQNNHLLNK